MTVGFVTENHCLGAEVELTGGVTWFADFARNLYAAGSPVADLAGLADWRPTRRYRSENHGFAQSLLFDFGDSKPVDLVALLALNLTAAGRVEVLLSDSADLTPPIWEGAATPNPDEAGLVFALPAQVSARYLQITLCDPTRDVLELGLAVAGAVVQPAYGLATGGQKGWRDGSSATPAQQAGLTVAARTPRRFWTLPFAVVAQEDADQLYQQLGGQLGLSHPLLCLESWSREESLYSGDWIYGLLNQGVTLKNLFRDHWSGSLQIEELPGRPGSGEGALGSSSLSLDQAAVDFTPGDPIFVGETVEQTVCLTAGAENLTLEAGVATVTGTACQLVGEGSFSLAAGQSKDLTLRFAPSLQGADQAGSLTIEHAASGSLRPLTVPLTGSALYAPRFAIFDNSRRSGRVALPDGQLSARVKFPVPAYTFPIGHRAAADMSHDTIRSYWEVTIIAFGTGAVGERIQIGFVLGPGTSNKEDALGSNADLDFGLTDKGETHIGGVLASLTGALSLGDVIGVAPDPVARKAWLRKNGVWLGGGDPEAGINPTFTWPDTGDLDVRPAVSLLGDVNPSETSRVLANFGASPFEDAPPLGWQPGHGENLENL
ncbi:hypothetical protein ACTL6U_21145 [Rhodovibrionaceae bacterium A322]